MVDVDSVAEGILILNDVIIRFFAYFSHNRSKRIDAGCLVFTDSILKLLVRDVFAMCVDEFIDEF